MERLSPAVPNSATVTAHLSFLRAASPLRSGSDGAAAALPTRLLLMKWGENKTNKGTFYVNERTLAVFEANQAKIKRPTIKGDFQHESCRPDVKHPIKFAVSSAVPRVIRGEGIVVENAEWTAEGKEHVPAHYSDLSAAPYHDSDGTVIALHSFAVCDHGEVDDMTVTPAALAADLALLSTAPSPDKPPMNPHTALLLKLLAAHGLTIAPDATPEQLSAAVETALKKPDGNPAELSTLSATINAAVATALKPLADQVAGLTTLSATTEIQRQIDQAAALGKLVTLSAEDLVKLGPDRTKAYLDALPADAVPLSQRTPAALSAGKPVQPAHDADYLQALADLGQKPAAATA